MDRLEIPGVLRQCFGVKDGKTEFPKGLWALRYEGLKHSNRNPGREILDAVQGSKEIIKQRCFEYHVTLIKLPTSRSFVSGKDLFISSHHRTIN